MEQSDQQVGNRIGMNDSVERSRSGVVLEIIDSAVVWDNVFPLEPWCGNDFERLERFRNAGYTAVSLTLAGDNQGVGQALRRLAAARKRILAEPDRYLLIQGVEDVLNAKRDGLLAVGFHFEGTRCFDRNLDVVDAFYQLGIRQTILAFNQSNSVGGGCAEEIDGGLTRFGRRLVRELNHVGMLIDLSHTGYRTSLETIELSEKPCVFSHSNAHALHPHFRNVRDDQIEACVAKGGMIGVSSSSEYLGAEPVDAGSLFRQIDYLVQRVGPEHVGFGFDFVFDAGAINDYFRSRPDEWPMAAKPHWAGVSFGEPELLVGVVEQLVTSGYSGEDIRKILGGNWMRVCSQVWR